MMEKLKGRIYQILEVASPDDRVSRTVDIVLMTLIVLNVAAVVIATLPELEPPFRIFLHRFEVFSVSIFTVEYFLRIWSCTARPKYAQGFSGRLRFMLTPYAVIDLAAILPFYLPLVFAIDLRFVRALRLLRLFRMFKFARYSKALKALGSVIYDKKEELTITVSAVLILLVFTSSFMYYFENEAQPDAFSSIPASMWWGISTLTTVGYGDVYPITPVGKTFGGFIALLGIGVFALPAGILASGFAGHFRDDRRELPFCPHCGNSLE